MSHTAVQTAAFYPGTFRAEFSTDGTNWTAFSNNIALIEPAEFTRPNESTHTGGSSQVPTVTVGKPNPVTIKLRLLYLDNNASAADRVLYARIRGNTPTLAVRWKPRGEENSVTVYATSNDGVTIGLVPFITFATPQLDPNSANAAMYEIQLVAPTLISYLAGSSTGLGS